MNIVREEPIKVTLGTLKANCIDLKISGSDNDYYLDSQYLSKALRNKFLQLSEQYNILSIGRLIGPLWYALVGDNLVWSNQPLEIVKDPSLQTGDCRPAPMIPMKKKFNRYTALLDDDTKKEKTKDITGIIPDNTNRKIQWKD